MLVRAPESRQVTPKHAYTSDPLKSEWDDYAAVQAECGNLSGNELTSNSSGNTRLQSSQLADPLWTNPGAKSGISVRKLIFTLRRKKKKTQAGKVAHSLKSSHARKTAISSLVLFCLVLLLFLSYIFLPAGPFFCTFFPENSSLFLVEIGFFVWLPFGN